jgi:uncharacterized protein
MRKIWLIILTVVSGLFLLAKIAVAVNFPEPTGYVNDFANIISNPVEEALEQRLSSFTASTSNELTVVTLKSLEGDSVENVAVDLFSQWGIGSKEKDNGVLLLISVEDRELRIEVGYGLEPVLTDARAGNIIRNEITPAFKDGDYDAGVTAGTEAIISVISGDPTLFNNQPQKSTIGEKFSLFFFLVMVLVYLSAFLARSKRIWPGGVLGFLLGAILISAVGAFFLGLWGLFLDWLISRNYKTRKAKGLPTSWWSSGGGFSGGSSSGGFGGFSGGSSGGGGSSGKW